MFRTLFSKSRLQRAFVRQATAFAPAAGRYRVRVLQEISFLRRLNQSTSKRLLALEGRWSNATESLSRQGICFINEARRIMTAIEKRQQRLAMLRWAAPPRQPLVRPTRLRAVLRGDGGVSVAQQGAHLVQDRI